MYLNCDKNLVWLLSRPEIFWSCIVFGLFLAIWPYDLVSRIPLDHLCMSNVYEACRMVSLYFFFYMNTFKNFLFKISNLCLSGKGADYIWLNFKVQYSFNATCPSGLLIWTVISWKLLHRVIIYNYFTIWLQEIPCNIPREKAPVLFWNNSRQYFTAIR